MALLLFLIQVFIISFSGAAQPGPITATAIALGGKNRYAGSRLALGHIVIEFPVMLLIFAGLSRFLELAAVKTAISLAGGTVLVIMAVQMYKSVAAADTARQKALSKNPILAGVILSAANPYFPLWWATIGMALATTAKGFGVWAFGLFALVHWLCDAVWLQALSWASFKGSELLGRRSERILLSICSATLLIFGLFFIYRASGTLFKLF